VYSAIKMKAPLPHHFVYAINIMDTFLPHHSVCAALQIGHVPSSSFCVCKIQLTNRIFGDFPVENTVYTL
jgi:hypothetical protein